MNKNHTTYIITGLLVIHGLLLSQSLVFDNTNSVFTGIFWPYVDSLELHGIEVYYISELGWYSINSIDLLWIPDLSTYYSDEIKGKIIEYSRNGGRILIWWHHSIFEMNILLNDLLLNTNWETTMSVSDLYMYRSEYVCCIRNLPPFTDNVDSIKIQGPAEIRCGNNAYPFTLLDSNCTIPVGAISFPFIHEDNCSSFIVLLTGADWFVSTYCDSLWSHPADNRRFVLNIIYSMLNVENYEFDPCAFAETTFSFEPIEPMNYLCSHIPNPFTPNSDGANDFCQFSFDGMENTEATIYIHNLHGQEVRSIKIPTGTGAKEAARWNGRDNDGNPLKQGLYMYVIESGGEVVCEGSVVIAR